MNNKRLWYFKSIVIITWIVFLSLLFFLVKQLEYSNSKWLNDDNPSQQAINILEEKFKKYEDVIIALDFKKDIFNLETISILENLEKELTAIAEVKEVITPLNATFLLNINQSLESTSYIKAYNNGNLKSLSELKNIFSKGFYYTKLLSADYTKVVVIVKIDTLYKDSLRKTVINNIKTKLTTMENFLPSPKLSGDGLLNYELNIKTQENLAKLLLIAFVIIGIIAFLMGGLKKLLIIWGVVITTVLSSMAIIYLNGHSLTSLSITLILMVSVVGVSDALHIDEYFNYINAQNIHRAKSKVQRIYLTIKDTIIPCFLTSLTTTIGFGTFMISKLIPLFEFGLDSSIAILISFILNIIFICSILYIFPNYKNKIRYKNKLQALYEVLIEKLLYKIANISVKYCKKIIIIFITIMGLFVVVLPFSKTESNFLDVFFAKDSDFYQDFIYLDKFFKGSGNFNILIKNNNYDYFKSEKALSDTIKTVRALEKIDNIKAVDSYLLPLNMVHEHFRLDSSFYPYDEEELAQELLFLELSRSDSNKGILEDYLDFSYQTSNILLQTNNLTSEQIGKLLFEINKVLAANNIKDSTITGSNEYFHTLSKDVLGTQFYSILLCFVIIFCIFLIFYKLKLAQKATLSAIFPIIFVLALIVISRTPFDFAIILVSSIALGISVDNTLHILSHYIRIKKQQKLEKLAEDMLIKSALLIPGKAIIQATFLFCIISLIFIFADLILLKKFGLFLSITLLVGFISSTVFFLALLNKSSSDSSSKI